MCDSVPHTKTSLCANVQLNRRNFILNHKSSLTPFFHQALQFIVVVFTDALHSHDLKSDRKLDFNVLYYNRKMSNTNEQVPKLVNIQMTGFQVLLSGFTSEKSGLSLIEVELLELHLLQFVVLHSFFYTVLN